MLILIYCVNLTALYSQSISESSLHDPPLLWHQQEKEQPRPASVQQTGLLGQVWPMHLEPTQPSCPLLSFSFVVLHVSEIPCFLKSLEPKYYAW